MPVNLSIKGVPEALAERLRARAAGNRRSLQRELMVIIETAVAQPDATRAPTPRRPDEAADIAGRRAQGNRPIEEIAAELRTVFPRARARGPSSADIIREMREGRYGGGARRSLRSGEPS